MFDTSIEASAPSPEMSRPQAALWWLRKGGFVMGPEWEKAHQLCQAQEGDRSHDLVHALAHWIEGDEANAAYWYRRVGGERAPSITDEWQRIAKILGN